MIAEEQKAGGPGASLNISGSPVNTEPPSLTHRGSKRLCGLFLGWHLRSGTASCPESAASHSWQSPEIVWEYHWVLAILPVWTNSRTLDKAFLTTSDCELYGTHVQNPTVELWWIPGVLGRCYPSEARTHEQWVWGQLILGWIFILQRASITISRYEISETLFCKKKKDICYIKLPPIVLPGKHRSVNYTSINLH